MIFYDLQCKDCDNTFTAFSTYSKLAEEKCPHCESTNHKRIFKSNIKGPVHGNRGGGHTPTSSGFT